MNLSIDHDPATSLDCFLKPRSIAVVGASDDPARISGAPLNFLLKGGYAGKIYPVNPNRSVVQGQPAWPSVTDLPEAPDLAILVVAAGNTLEAVRQCAARGVRCAVLLSAGYAETGAAGAALQDEIGRVARAAGMRLIGPNCVGLFNSGAGVYATSANNLAVGLPRPGCIGIASQSGAYAGHLLYLGRNKGLGLRHWITTGNEVDVTVSEAIHWLALQPEIKVILAYAEAIRDGERFVAALRAAHAQGKSVIMLKAGRSRAGVRAAASHTAALAGADQVYDAIFRQYGVYRAQTTEEILDIAYAAEKDIYPPGERLGIVTTSGGTGVQMCDAADDLGLEVPVVPDAVRPRLQAILPFASVGNPVDVTGQLLNDVSLVEQALPVMLDDCDLHSVVVSLGTVAGNPKISAALREALVRGVGARRDRLVVLNFKAPPEVERAYSDAGFLVYEDSYRAVRAVAALCQLRRAHAMPLGDVAIDAADAMTLPQAPLNEFEAKRLLAAAGVPVLPERLAANADAAVTAAAALGYPVVLKIVSVDLPHKTEVGGVALNLADATAVRTAHAAMLARVTAAAPQARIAGVLVAPMARRGVETIIGVTRDATFGPMVMFGVGGIFVEIFKDVAFRRAPFDVDEAHRMINEIKGRALLQGARGLPPCDIDALAATLAAVSQFAAANPAITSIDINPFVVFEQGAGGVALDALLDVGVDDGKDGGKDGAQQT